MQVLHTVANLLKFLNCLYKWLQDLVNSIMFNIFAVTDCD